MKEFFENWGCLIYCIIIAIFFTFIPQKDEYRIELEQEIETLEQENEMLKNKYCQLKAEDLYCISYAKEKKEIEELEEMLKDEK